MKRLLIRNSQLINLALKIVKAGYVDENGLLHYAISYETLNELGDYNYRRLKKILRILLN